MSDCGTGYPSQTVSQYIEDGYIQDGYFEKIVTGGASLLRKRYRFRHTAFWPQIVESGGADAAFDVDLVDAVGLIARVAGIARVVLSCETSPVDVFLRVGRPLRISVKQILSVGTTATGITTLHYP